MRIESIQIIVSIINLIIILLFFPFKEELKRKIDKKYYKIINILIMIFALMYANLCIMIYSTL